MNVSKDTLDLIFFNKNNYNSINNNAEKLCSEICSTSIEQLILIALTQNRLCEISAKNIPQFSNFCDGSYNATKIVTNTFEMNLNYLKVGKMLLPIGKRDTAYIKYGENHLKLAQGLGLIEISNGIQIRPTDLGEKSLKIERLNFEELATRLIFRIPVVCELFKQLVIGPVSSCEYLIQFLSESTAGRRATNLRFLVKRVINNLECKELKDIISNNLR